MGNFKLHSKFGLKITITLTALLANLSCNLINATQQVPGPFPLQGIWHNDLGSTMRLDQSQDGRLVGNYSTAVESSPGAAGAFAAPLSGHSNLNLTTNPTFGFSVSWSAGNAAFAGQYYYENGVEVLETTWLLTKKVANLADHWKSTRVGFNTFTRTSQIDRDLINN